ncbi:MAG TPA: MarR family transcriptional regulator [Propionicimonas sp.]
MTNRDAQVLLTIHRRPGLAPSALADRLGISRALVSQSLGRFHTAGLITRDLDPVDHRSWRVSLSALGRRRVHAFEAQLGSWLSESAPTVRAMLTLLDRAHYEESGDPVAPLDAVAGLAAAGAPYVADVTTRLLPFGAASGTDRHALTILNACGSQRPVELAVALSLTTSGVSALLDRLETAGLVQRRHGSADSDRKAVEVSLTDRGAEAAQITLDEVSRHADRMMGALAATLKVRPEADGWNTRQTPQTRSRSAS